MLLHTDPALTWWAFPIAEGVCLILALLVILVVNGISVCKANYKRSFKTVGISYSWATASLPFSAGMMCITMLKNCLDQIQILRGKASQLKEGECA